MAKRQFTRFLLMAMIFLLAGCSLPEVTPVPSPTVEIQPTSTAPVAPTAVLSTPSPAAQIAAANVENAAKLQALTRAPGSNVQALVWSLDGSSVSTVMQNSNGSDQLFTATILNIPDLAPKGLWAAPAGTQRVSVSPDGKTAAAISKDMNTVSVVDITSGNTLQTIQPGFQVMQAVFSPDGKWLVISSFDAWKAVLYDPSTGEIVNTLTGFETAAPVYDVGFASSLRWLVWHARGTIQVQDPTSGAMGASFNHEDFVSAFTVSADGKYLASAAMKTIGSNPTAAVYLWDAASGVEITDLALPSSATALSFSPDASLLAVAEGSEIEIWNVSSATLITTLKDNDVIYQLAFSPDGKYLASSAQNNQITLWGVTQ